MQYTQTVGQAKKKKEKKESIYADDTQFNLFQDRQVMPLGQKGELVNSGAILKPLNYH